jgi:hypothetical protein
MEMELEGEVADKSFRNAKVTDYLASLSLSTTHLDSQLIDRDLILQFLAFFFFLFIFFLPLISINPHRRDVWRTALV